ncbi:MAG: tRNA-(ms[2]io[6]A)-hydroxylase [Motiliproteus sp.]|nr:tRNA-(ms[2]io[6]A)-hydroxylase [Motiliproteus sp.]MCW9053225.1 tRNA-(ms[2]io[6]A)-hydroxylase [Motiliproteus sp.]
MNTDLEQINNFLHCETPYAWVDVALANQDILLIDHLNCEKKAASMAMSLIHKYRERTELLYKMARLAREELMHFTQVLKIMESRGVTYGHVTASRYGAGFHKHIRTHEPAALVDKLIIGAYIEGRSCERFAKIAPYLDEELQRFYTSLLKSEARHFQDYLDLAQLYSDEDIADRVAEFGEIEKDLILSPDTEFRFHSGIPPQ